MKKLTIGIVYFNERELLTECLATLLPQLSEQDEVLVYDNGSESPAASYVSADSRLKIIRSEQNHGPAFARNRLLEAATGDFIHFHDSDDWFYPNWAQVVRERIEQAPLDVVFSEVDSFVEGREQKRRVVGLSHLSKGLDLVSFCIQHFMLVPCGTYRVDFLRGLGGYRESLWQSEDYDFHLRVALAKPRVAIVIRPLVGIRIRKESRSQNRAETVRDAVKTLEMAIPLLSSDYSAELAERLSEFGTQMYALSLKQEARQVMQLASSLSRPRFYRRKPSFRFLAFVLGQYSAESLSAFFRHWLSAKVSRELSASTNPVEKTQS